MSQAQGRGIELIFEPGSTAAADHEPALAKHAQVSRKRGSAKVGVVEQFSRKLLAFAERLHDAASRAMTQGAKDIFGAEGATHISLFS